MICGQDEPRGRIERERVVRLATIGGRGRAHVRRACSRSTAGSSARRLPRGRAAAGRAAAQSGPGPPGHDPGRLLRRGLAEGAAVRAARHRPARVQSARMRSPAGAGVPAVRPGPLPRLVAGYWGPTSRSGPAGPIAGFGPGYCGPEEHVRNGRPRGCCHHGLTPLVPRASLAEWLGSFVEATAARESARNAAVGGKCGK
jgi:hypothetical protein